ncbi:MAG: reverse transcriptase-like protein [bacterium]|nr:reverse transcriptase-like protein [bacterium]
MKTLKFNHIEAVNIQKGIQTATLRMKDEKDISVDDVLEIVDQVQESDESTWRVIGKATVDEVHVRRAKDLPLEGEGFEQFGSLIDLYNKLEVFYGDPIKDDTHVKVIRFTFTPYEEEKKFGEDQPIEGQVAEMKLYSDGGSRGNPGPSASGFVLMDMNGTILESNGEYLNVTTNNQAEYHSLFIGLERAYQMGAKVVHSYMDSLLVVNQMKGKWKVRNQELLAAHQRVNSLVHDFERVTFQHVPRELNTLADAEVNKILDNLHGKKH